MLHVCGLHLFMWFFYIRYYEYIKLNKKNVNCSILDQMCYRVYLAVYSALYCFYDNDEMKTRYNRCKGYYTHAIQFTLSVIVSLYTLNLKLNQQIMEKTHLQTTLCSISVVFLHFHYLYKVHVQQRMQFLLWKKVDSAFFN